MATVLQATVQIRRASEDLFELAHLRLAGAPVDGEVLSSVAEISRAIDEIRDNITEGVE